MSQIDSNEPEPIRRNEWLAELAKWEQSQPDNQSEGLSLNEIRTLLALAHNRGNDFIKSCIANELVRVEWILEQNIMGTKSKVPRYVLIKRKNANQTDTTSKT